MRSELRHTEHPVLPENPLEAIRNAIVFSSKDMGEDKRDAWIYGIVVGWDDESYKELAVKHGWNKEAVDRNKRLHEKYQKCWLYIQ